MKKLLIILFMIIVPGGPAMVAGYTAYTKYEHVQYCDKLVSDVNANIAIIKTGTDPFLSLSLLGVVESERAQIYRDCPERIAK